MADIAFPPTPELPGNIVAFNRLGKGFTQRRMTLFAANKKGPEGPFYHHRSEHALRA